MTKKVVLTGATSFIGKSLVPHLLERGYEVHALVRKPADIPGTTVHLQSLVDESGLRRLLQELKPDFAIHLASLVSPGRQLDDLSAQIESTIETAATLALALPGSVKLAIFTRSADEYGNHRSPLTEESPVEALSTYGWAKLSAFHIVQLIAKNRALPVSWIRPFLVFGPGQTGDRFIPTVIRGCLDNRTVDLTACEQTRDLVYVADVCTALIRILEHPQTAAGETFNLSSENPLTLRAVAETIREQIGRGRLNFGAIPYRANENMDLYGSSAKFRRKFGELTLTPFDRALRETIATFRQDHHP